MHGRLLSVRDSHIPEHMTSIEYCRRVKCSESKYVKFVIRMLQSRINRTAYK